MWLIHFLKATATWAAADRIGPIPNRNLYILLLVPLGLIMLAWIIQPKTQSSYRIVMTGLVATLLPATALVLAVTAVIVFGMTFA